MVGEWNASAGIGGLRKKRESKGGVDISLLLKVVEEFIDTFILPGISLDLRCHHVFAVDCGVGPGGAGSFGLGWRARACRCRECGEQLNEPPPRDIEIHDPVLCFMGALRKKTSSGTILQIAENSARGANQRDNWLEGVLPRQLNNARRACSLNLTEAPRALTD